MPDESSKQLLTVVGVSGLVEMTDEEIDALADAMYSDMVAKIGAMSASPEPDEDG